MHDSLPSKEKGVPDSPKPTMMEMRAKFQEIDHQFCDFVKAKAILGELKMWEVPERYKTHRQICRAVLYNDPDALQNALEYVRDDKDLVIRAMKRNGDQLGFASERLQRDYDVVLAAVTNDGHAIRLAPLEMRENKNICLAAVNSSLGALRHMSTSMAGWACPHAQYARRVAAFQKWAFVRRNRTRIVCQLGGCLEDGSCFDAKTMAKVDLWLHKNKLSDWIHTKPCKRAKRQRAC